MTNKLEYFEIESRDKKIFKIPVDLANTVPVFNIAINGKWKNEPYYLNYSEAAINKFLDYIANRNIGCITDIISLIDEVQYHQFIDFDKDIMFVPMRECAQNLSKITSVFKSIRLITTKIGEYSLCTYVGLLTYLTLLSYNTGLHLMSFTDTTYLKDTVECPCRKYKSKYTEEELLDARVPCFDLKLDGSKFILDTSVWYSYHSDSNVKTPFYNFGGAEEYSISYTNYGNGINLFNLIVCKRHAI